MVTLAPTVIGSAVFLAVFASVYLALKKCLCRSSKKENADNNNEKIWSGDLEACTDSTVEIEPGISAEISALCRPSMKENTDNNNGQIWSGDIKACTVSTIEIGPGISAEISTVNTNVSGIVHKCADRSNSSSFPFDTEDFQYSMNATPSDLSTIPFEKRSRSEEHNDSNFSESSPSNLPLPSKVESTESGTLAQSSIISQPQDSEDPPITQITSPKTMIYNFQGGKDIGKKISDQQNPYPPSDFSYGFEERCTGLTERVVKPFEHVEEDLSDKDEPYRSNIHSDSLSHSSCTDDQEDEDFVDKGYEVDDDSSTSVIFPLISASGACDESDSDCSGSVKYSLSSSESKSSLSSTFLSVFRHSSKDTGDEMSTSSSSVVKNPESSVDAIENSTANSLSLHRIADGAIEGNDALEDEDGSLPEIDANSIGWDFSSTGSCDKSFSTANSSSLHRIVDSIIKEKDALKNEDGSLPEIDANSIGWDFSSTGSCDKSSFTTNSSSIHRIDDGAIKGKDVLENEDGSLPEMTDADSICWDFSSAGSCDKSSSTANSSSIPRIGDGTIEEKENKDGNLPELTDANSMSWVVSPTKSCDKSSTVNSLSIPRIGDGIIEENDILGNKDGSLPELTDANSMSWDVSSTESCDSEIFLGGSSTIPQEDVIVSKHRVCSEEEGYNAKVMALGLVRAI